MATNQQRSISTRARLTGVARQLFAQHGYAGTSTEAILEGADLGRGALYHHFADKAALFEAVCVVLAEEALPVVHAAAGKGRGPLDRLVRGSIAWVEFTTRDDVRRILLVDAPTVLGWERWQALDDRLSVDALRVGIRKALDSGEIVFDGGADLLTTMANGALNALALRISGPAPSVSPRDWRRAVRAYWRALAPAR